MNRELIGKIKSFLQLAGFFLLVLYFISGYVLAVYKIEGESMNPLLVHGDRVVSDRLVYKLSPIERYDIVVMHSPAEPRKFLIKRVIGLPDETIRIDNGSVYVDGKKIDDDYVPDEFRSSETIKSTRIPKGHYFVAGDNRGISNDSRVWATQANHWPFVGERYIIGKIRGCVWPISRVSWISSKAN